MSFQIEKDQFQFIVHYHLNKLQKDFFNSINDINYDEIVSECVEFTSRSINIKLPIKDKIKAIFIKFHYVFDCLEIQFFLFHPDKPDDKLYSNKYYSLDLRQWAEIDFSPEIDKLYIDFYNCINEIEMCKSCEKYKIVSNLFNGICVKCTTLNLIKIKESKGQCAICQEEVNSDIYLAECCNKYFHDQCIETFKRNKCWHNIKCPLCRSFQFRKKEKEIQVTQEQKESSDEDDIVNIISLHSPNSSSSPSSPNSE